MGFLCITVLWATAPVAATAVETAARVLALLLPWLLLLLLLPWKLRRGCCFLGFSCCFCSRGNYGVAASSVASLVAAATVETAARLLLPSLLLLLLLLWRVHAPTHWCYTLRSFYVTAASVPASMAATL
jgi:hypothetical protein